MNRDPTGTWTLPFTAPRRAAARAGRLALTALAVLALGAGSRPPAAWADDPWTGSPGIADARLLADAKLFDLAAAVLRDALVRDPSDRPARSLLARVLAWNRRFDESIAEYERLVAERPDDAFERAAYARVLAWSGRGERSLEEFRRAIATDSSNMETRVGYARALFWTGDLAGAALEYRRILETDPAHGDAWLGYATVARRRTGATAADRFLARAEALGAEPAAAREERAAIGQALEPSLGAGWQTYRERQYAEGPDFTYTSRGPFAVGHATVGRAADLSVRAAWLDLSERSESGTLNYDLDARLLRAEVAVLRGYPFQASASLESRAFRPGVTSVAYPLIGAGDFVGWDARAWWFLGRLTPAIGTRRDFVPIKSATPVGVRVGHQTRLEGSLAWQWSGRGSAAAGIERGAYSDGNVRRGARGSVAYRFRLRNPVATIDYGIAVSDFDRSSRSYFTPLGGVRHTAGIGLGGYAPRGELDYGARYQFSHLASDNFETIRSGTWSAYLHGTALGILPLGIEGSYSRDNNAYEIWSIAIHAAARW